MKILIDGDACPVKKEIAELGKRYNIDILYICSICHFSDQYLFPDSIIVDNESQAADIEIINNIQSGDIVISQDYGLASIALDKKAYAISFHGKKFTKQNIDHLLFQRHLSLEQRKNKQRTTKQKKRQKKDDVAFKESLEKLILQILNPQ